MEEMNEIEMVKITIRSYKSLPYFLSNVFPYSYNKKEYIKVPHFDNWGTNLENNRFTALQAPRKHLKSYLMYGKIMWELFKSYNENVEGAYISFNQKMASKHLKNIKPLIDRNPFFENCESLTKAAGILEYSWNGDEVFDVQPYGIFSFTRGLHPDFVICDDILADPTNELNLTVINKIAETFWEDLMSLPKEKTGELHLVGTPQDERDLFWQVKQRSHFSCIYTSAILSENKPLWPEMFSYKRLMEIRDEIGEKAFSQEYLCIPIRSSDRFFEISTLEAITDSTLKNVTTPLINDDYIRMAGVDIGKHRHPSYFCIFEQSPSGIITQIYSHFFDKTNYSDQVAFIKQICSMLGVKKLYYDATRGEWESMKEMKILPRSFIPISFNTKTKGMMASAMDKFTMNTDEIKIFNDERIIRQLSQVSNDLTSEEDTMGHGDAFWGMALALLGFEKKKSNGPLMILMEN